MKKIVIGIIIVAALGLAGYVGYAGANSSAKDKVAKPVVTNTTEAKPDTHASTASATIKTPEEALNLLKVGNQRFVEDKSTVNNVSTQRRKELENGQHPYATIISCSDSRVTPALVFNAGLGDIFDIRLAGNVVDDSALGSIEYAVDHLHTPVIVVMGHEKCGAVTAAYDQVVKGQEAHGHVEDLVDEIEPAVKKNGTIDEAIRQNVVDVVAEVKKDPVVAKAIKAGQVKVVGAYYDLDGRVTFNN
ncbi:carbonic anhydrase [uncultured Clostridium sp.]|uniref:carbonic anhydrase n=1 Tax=uncultured Clostridium sp. TaxID=59620 RepID=UPI0026152D7A|nr:carbonic anhydrase [uncultured Clostridium sp.]